VLCSEKALVAATSLDPVDTSYEDFVALHADRFGAYLRGVLGRAAEGRGGRVAVDDTLQEALLQIYAKWPELQELRDEERDRRLYRYLRDAAGQALRAEHGQLREGSGRPRVIAFDFSAAQVSGVEQSAHERELTSAILGAMVRDLAAAERDRDARAMLDRGILVAGLRALSEREAVLLIAADHLGWDQHQLAERLGMGFAHLRRTLFEARKVFYALVRHAVGLEVEEEERARLAAYLAGELVGKEKREARRHLQHCRACQELQREQRVFGRDALGVLSPLPFIFGAGVLAKRSAIKGATLGGGSGSGLFAQAGAAKATAVVVGLLGIGVGTTAWLARDAELPPQGSLPAPGYVAPPPGMKRTTVATSTPAAHEKAKARRSTRARSRPHRAASSSGQAQKTATQRQQTTQSASSPPPASTPATKPSGAGAGSGGGRGGEFFGEGP
jgi:DNA-directed RNA polymerase specialized sigma24 family protein